MHMSNLCSVVWKGKERLENCGEGKQQDEEQKKRKSGKGQTEIHFQLAQKTTTHFC